MPTSRHYRPYYEPREKKDVFGSSAKYPCLTRYLYSIESYEKKVTKPKTKPMFSLLQTELDCKYMFDYFEKTGLSSHTEHVKYFNIPMEAIVKSTLTLHWINDHFGESLTENELIDLVWGNQ